MGIYVLSNNVFHDVLYAAVYWAAGFIATAQTDWCVRTGLAIQRKYPRAFPSRLPERAWYPKFIKTLGSFCLLVAGWHTVRFTLAFWQR
jgi:hypothetical protein